MEKRPNVFPTNTQQPSVESNQYYEQPQAVDPNGNDKVVVDNEYESKRMEMAGEIYMSSMGETGMSAVEVMRRRTEEQIKLRNEQLRKNTENIQTYQNQYETASQQVKQVQQPSVQQQVNIQQQNFSSEPKSPITNMSMPESSVNNNLHIQQLSQPQFNAPFDVIPLPSEGKLYKNKKSSVKVAYMTTADENILTSPNLLESGQFLEILINRKLLEQDLRYKDLHLGDRNAIMLWLRATSYGEMYEVTIYDEDNNPFRTEIDLTNLKTKKLTVEPDSEGYFDFQLPVSKMNVKFKLLTVGDLEDIEKLSEKEKEAESIVSNVSTYTLEKQIIEINGQRDKNVIREIIPTLRIKDTKELRNYINKIDCGVDLEIEVRTPRGGSVKTFLPLNIGFFWPDIEI